MTEAKKIQKGGKTLLEIFDLEDRADALIERMFKKYYSGEELNNWQQITFFGGGNINKYKSKIKELLEQGKIVKTGYRTSSMVRGSKTHYIFYK